MQAGTARLHGRQLARRPWPEGVLIGQPPVGRQAAGDGLGRRQGAIGRAVGQSQLAPRLACYPGSPPLGQWRLCQNAQLARLRGGVVARQDEQSRDRLSCVLITLPGDGEKPVPEEGARPQHGRQLKPGDAHLPAFWDHQLVGLLDRAKGFLLGRPRLKGDELTRSLVDDQAVAHELDKRRRFHRPPVADQGDHLLVGEPPCQGPRAREMVNSRFHGLQ